MPTIALVQHGTEVARQRYADVWTCFVRACDELSSTRGLSFAPQVFTDDAVRFLLNGISPEEFSCVVFASNALLSDQVRQAVLNYGQELERYVRSGGGVLVLHQLRPSLEDVLPADLCPRLAERRASDGVRAHADVADDLTLRYPKTVPLERLADHAHSSGPGRLYWTALERDSMPQKLQPILSAGEDGSEVLLARTVSGIRERVVVATVPLDWRGDVELLANAIRYVSLGEPRRLLWLPESLGPRTDLVLRWLYSDGATAVSSMSDPQGISAPDRWLFDRVEVCIVPPQEFDAVRVRPEIAAFVGRGGTLITADPVPALGATAVSALIGAYSQRALSRRLYAELGANAAWMSFDNAFHLRNIVTTLAMFTRKKLDDSALAIRPDAVAHLVVPIRARLQQEEHREDLSSSLALGEILCHLVPEPRGDASLFDWMDRPHPPDEEDVRLQIRALRSRWLCRPDPHFVPQAHQLLQKRASLGPPQSFAPVVRLLDAVAMLDDAGLLTSDDASLAGFAEALGVELAERPPEADVGWVSVEATADVTRGLVVIIDHLKRPDLQEMLAGHVAGGAMVLRGALRGFGTREPSVAWLSQLARLVQAQVLVDERFPVGLQRLASLEWPGQGPANEVSSIAEDSLMGDLAVQVKDLRVKERELQDQRLSAAIGRSAATLGGVLIVALPFALVLWMYTPTSARDWVANIGVLGPVFVLALGFLFTLLKRWYLLTAWGARVQELLGKVSEVLAKIPKLKRAPE